MNMDKILDRAIEKDASDVHLICGNKPMLRIARELVPIEEMEVLTVDDMNEMYDFLVRGNVDKDELFNTTRKLDTSYEYNGIRLRVNISLSDDIPLCTLRLIKNTLPPYESLGLPDIIRRMTYQQQGLILVTGKTNSGKSTTLNALINEINETQNKKILTLENPVEYKHHSKKSLIVQKEVGKGGDALTFSDGVKNSLREDCDILVIGEIRDKITMEAAIEMAESGHLVIGTLHTKSCAETIDRMINFYEVRESQYCAIGNVIVSPCFRNRGVGTFLINAMEDIGKKKYNVSELHLSCFDANTSGLLLYTKLGYKPYEIEKYINKENEVSALIELKKVL